MANGRILVGGIRTVSISITSPVVRNALVGGDALELTDRTSIAAPDCFQQRIGLSSGDNCCENGGGAEEPNGSREAPAVHVDGK